MFCLLSSLGDLSRPLSSSFSDFGEESVEYVEKNPVDVGGGVLFLLQTSGVRFVCSVGWLLVCERSFFNFV